MDMPKISKPKRKRGRPRKNKKLQSITAINTAPVRNIAQIIGGTRSKVAKKCLNEVTTLPPLVEPSEATATSNVFVPTTLSQHWLPGLVDVTKQESSINTETANTMELLNNMVTSSTTNTYVTKPIISTSPIICPEESLLPDNSNAKHNNKKDNIKLKVFKSSDQTYDPAVQNMLPPIMCFLCTEIFSSFSAMQIHYFSTHKNNTKRRNKENSTDAAFKNLPSTAKSKSKETKKDTSINLDKQDEVRLSSDSEMKCTSCCISFKNKGDLKKHISQVHSYICSYCHSVFYTLFQFTNHNCKNKKTLKNDKKRKVLNNNNSSKSEVLGSQASSSSSSTSNSSTSSINNNNGNNLGLKPRVNPECKYIHIQPKPPTLPLSTNSSIPKQVPFLLELPPGLKLSATNTAFNTAFINSVVSHCNSPSQQQSIDKSTIISSDPSPISSITSNYNNCITNNSTIITNDIIPVPCDKVCDSPKLQEPTKEDIIKQKLKQVIQNPNLSVSFLPCVVTNTCDNEYTCGRCNVLCEDLTDYMDHIQDCLYYTNVSLEPVTAPSSQRLLNLKNENTSYRLKEICDSKFSINPSLIQKLRSVLEPKLLTGLEEDIKNSEKFGNLCTKKVINTEEEEKITEQTNKIPIPQLNIVPVSKSLYSSQNKDNLDKFVSTEKVPDRILLSKHLLVSQCPSRQSLDSSKANSISNQPPMVIIPIKGFPQSVGTSSAHIVGPNCYSSNNYNLQCNETIPFNCIKNEIDVRKEGYSLNPLSDTDYLLQPDDIKMEIEEELIDDFY